MRDAMLIGHFIGLAMGLGTSIAFQFLGMAAAKLEKEEAVKFVLNTFVLARMGNFGLGLLFLTGGYLMTPYWSSLADMPIMVTKLLLFVALGAILGIISSNAKKANKADDPIPYMGKIRKLGKVALFTSLTIVVLAVLQYH